MFSNIFYFHPYLGKIPMLTNIFQMGWNHQLENIFSKRCLYRDYRCVNWDHLHRRTRVDDNGGREFNGDIKCQAFFGSWADKKVEFLVGCCFLEDLWYPDVWCILTYMFHEFEPHVGKSTIHGADGIESGFQRCFFFQCHAPPRNSCSPKGQWSLVVT